MTVVPAQLPDEENLGEYFCGSEITFYVTCKFRDRDTLEESVVNLTGATVWCGFKIDLTDDDGEAPGFQLSTLSAGVSIVGNPVDGLVKVVIGPEQTQALAEPTQFYWTLQARSVAIGGPHVFGWGTIMFHLDAVRAIA